MRRIVVTSGVESEYVLKELSEYLRRCGWEVFELEFGVFKGDPFQFLSRFRGCRAVYITSAHTNLTKVLGDVLAPSFSRHYPNYISPLEIIKFLKPALSIYVPHDLLTPYGDTNLSEYRFLDLFDVVLAPSSASTLQAVLGAQTRVIEAGWIKNTNPPMEIEQSNIGGFPKIALFVSMIEHLRFRYGIDGVVEYFAPLFNENVKIKLPAWKGVQEIESFINARFPNSVVPAESGSINLIRESDVVVCNGASSIHAEANLIGKPTVCLLDNEGVTIGEQRKRLRFFPSIYFHDYRARRPISDDEYTKIISQAKNRTARRFEYESVLDIINSNYWFSESRL